MRFSSGVSLAVSVALGAIVPLRLGAKTTAPTMEGAGGGGWRSLFDGHSLAGWRGFATVKPGAGWKVADGAIVLSGESAGGGDLVTVDEFGDFELSLEWKVADETNSGIIYRVGLDAPQTYSTGPEYQVLDNLKAEDRINPTHRAGSLYDLVAPPQDFTKPVGEWNRARIVVRGWKIEHWLNGHKIVDVDLASPAGRALIADSKFAAMPRFATLRRGHLALQNHGHPVSFRSIRVRELKSSPNPSLHR
jgi:hypothetical protein